MAEIAPIFLDNLIEVLIGIILLFNVGAYGMLWNKTEDNEEDVEEVEKDLSEEIKEVKEDVDSLEEGQTKIMRTMYGAKQDQTDQGHIVNTEEEFEKVHKRIDDTDKCRRREHQEVKGLLLQLVDELDKDENVELDMDVSKHKYGMTDDD